MQHLIASVPLKKKLVRFRLPSLGKTYCFICSVLSLDCALWLGVIELQESKKLILGEAEIYDIWLCSERCAFSSGTRLYLLCT